VTNEKTPREKGKARARAKKAARFSQDVVISLRENIPPAALILIAFSASFGHLSELTGKYGPGGWVHWAAAGTVDLLVVIAAEERQRDKRIGRRRKGWASWPTVVLAFGIFVTLVANVETAVSHTFWGYAVSGWPAAAMLLAVSIFERRASFEGEVPGTGTGTARGTAPNTTAGTGEGAGAGTGGGTAGSPGGASGGGSVPGSEDGTPAAVAAKYGIAVSQLQAAISFRHELASTTGETATKERLRLALRVGSGTAHTLTKALAEIPVDLPGNGLASAAGAMG
jgi:hypothetical protein